MNVLLDVAPRPASVHAQRLPAAGEPVELPPYKYHTYRADAMLPSCKYQETQVELLLYSHHAYRRLFVCLQQMQQLHCQHAQISQRM